MDPRERVRWHEVTGIFGGTFDPPHLGHREAVAGLFKYPKLSRVIVVPTASPPHKPTQASGAQRLEMTRLAFEGLPLGAKVEIDDREIRRGVREPSRPSYSFDTLQELRKEVPSLAFVIGTDQLTQLHTWHRFPELLGLSHWIVLARKPRGEDEAGNILRDWEASGLAKASGSLEWRLKPQDPGSAPKTLILAPTDAPELSSSQIRQTLARQGKPADNSLLASVESYLKLHRIYGMQGT